MFKIQTKIKQLIIIENNTVPSIYYLTSKTSNLLLQLQLDIP